MESASSKTYISKRMMEQYKKQRASRAQQQAEDKKPKVAKKFTEDNNEEEKKMEEQPQIQAPQALAAQQNQALDAIAQGAATNKAEAQDMNSEVAPQQKKGLFGRMADSLFGSSKKEAMIQSQSMNRNDSFGSNQMQEMDRNLSCEEMDSDDLGGDLNLSDNEDGQEMRSMKRNVQKSRRGAGQIQKAHVYRQEFDTNVFEVALSCLADKGQMATGDAEICTKCQAVFNKTSVLSEKDGEQIWKCEFCYHENEVMIGEEEIPQALEVTYLLEASAQVQDAAAGGKAAQDISVVFCMDISGSMCVSQPVQGKHQLKGDNLKALQAQMKQFGDGSDQFMDQRDRQITYVSRIQCVKAAIDSQINDMANGAGQRKIGIVSFNNEVQVIGDGTQSAQTITGDHLNNFEWLQNNGKAQAAERLTQPISATKETLSAKLDAIEETGPTALGPGILTSVAMAAEGSAGSTVVICTDGLANIGLGAWDECRTEAESQATQQFYERVGQIASTAGVTINIVSIEGDECNLDALSTLAELTGGKVERVNPTNLTKDFANMLSVPVLATNVEAKVKLHKGLHFRNELATDLSEDKSLLARRFGNTTQDTIFTFEYGIKAISELIEMEEFDMSSITHFPFQCQIKYTALDGSKCLRVITKQMEVSGEREELNQFANAEMLQKNVVQKGTQMARAGNIRQAQAIMKGFKRQVDKNFAPQQKAMMQENYSAQVQDVYGQLGNAYDSAGEEQFEEVQEQRQEQMMSMQPQMQSLSMAMPSAPQSRGMAMAPQGMAMRGPPMAGYGAQMQALQEDCDEEMEDCMPMQSMAAKSRMRSSAAPQQQKKSKAKATSNIGGQKRLNDELSTNLFKMSKM